MESFNSYALPRPIGNFEEPGRRETVLEPRRLLHQTHGLRPGAQRLREGHRVGADLPQGLPAKSHGAQGHGTVIQSSIDVRKGSGNRLQLLRGY